MKTKKGSPNQFVICIDNSDYLVSLELHKVYTVLPDARASEDDYLRIVDERGEDYIYAAKRFVPVELPERARRSVVRKVRESTILATAPSSRLHRKLKSRPDPVLNELHKARKAIAKAHGNAANKIAASIPALEEAVTGNRRSHSPKRTSRQHKAS